AHRARWRIQEGRLLPLRHAQLRVLLRQRQDGRVRCAVPARGERQGHQGQVGPRTDLRGAPAAPEGRRGEGRRQAVERPEEVHGPFSASVLTMLSAPGWTLPLWETPGWCP